MTHRERSRAAVALLVLAAALGVGACGGSSSTNPRASAYANAAGGFTGREAAARRCLDKHGLLPLGESRSLFPAGETLASRIGESMNFTAALNACGIGSPHGPTFVEVLLPTKTLTTLLDAWTTCIAKNGYDLPTPNTSGTGPVFPVGTDRISRYRAAATHCMSIERHEIAAIRLAAQS